MSLKRRTPLKRTAFKRAPRTVPKRHDVPDDVREAVWLRCAQRCEARIAAAGCQTRAVHIHHRRLRSQGGGNDPELLLAVCSKCHHYIHHAGQEAYDQGWLVRSWQ